MPWRGVSDHEDRIVPVQALHGRRQLLARGVHPGPERLQATPHLVRPRVYHQGVELREDRVLREDDATSIADVGTLAVDVFEAGRARVEEVVAHGGVPELTAAGRVVPVEGHRLSLDGLGAKHSRQRRPHVLCQAIAWKYVHGWATGGCGPRRG